MHTALYVDGSVCSALLWIYMVNKAFHYATSENHLETKCLGQNLSLLGIKTKCNFAPKCTILHIKFPKTFEVMPSTPVVRGATTFRNPLFYPPLARPLAMPGGAPVRHHPSFTPLSNTFRGLCRKSTTRISMSLRWTSYVVPKPTKGWLKNAVSKVWTINCDNSETVWDRMSVTINH